MSRMTVAQALDLAIKHHQTGQIKEAEHIYRQILAVDGRNARALQLLGVVAQQCGQYKAAADLIGQALAIDPNDAAAYTNLGEALRCLGRLPEAKAAILKSLAINPASPEATGNLGIVYSDMGDAPNALAYFKKSLAMNPTQARVHNNLGNLLLKNGDREAALASYDRALQLDPNFSDGHNNRGSALEKLDRLEEASAEYQRAVELQPQFAIACNNAGNIFRRLSQWDDALRWCNRALEIDPSYEPARWNVGLIELTRGDYASGLPKYELRFTATEQRLPPNIDRPRWDGQPLQGRTILLYAEQGLGDGWQAARYVPLVAAGGGRIIIEGYKSQASLMRNLPGVVAVIASGQPRPPYDVFAPMMSLPLLFKTTLETIPREFPYLQPDAQRVAAWRDRLAAHSGFKVGLIWNGSAQPEPLRSISLDELAPLASVPGVRYFSLQFGKAAADVKTSPAWTNMVDLSADVADFGETAACMMNLDLVLTIDTAAAHLAGALARPTWTLLPTSPDWRWLLDREDSPWYPTMKLFRQTQRKVWTDVVERVRQAIFGALV